MARTRTDEEREEDRLKIANLLLAHTSIRQMAALLELNKDTVVADVRAIREEWKEARADAYDRYAAEELPKLDALERAMWADAMKGSGWAVERVLQVMNHRAMLLGLYAPTRRIVDFVPRDVLVDEMQRLEAEVAALEAEGSSHDRGDDRGEAPLRGTGRSSKRTDRSEAHTLEDARSS